MSKKTTKSTGRSRRKFVEPKGKIDRIDLSAEGSVQLSLPIAEILAGVGDAVERVTAEAGLLIMKALIDEEVETLAGKRYAHQESRKAYRWGLQESHVVYGGKKKALKRPRVRGTDGKEIPLERLGLFQNLGHLQKTAAKQVTLGVSMRDYETAVDDLCEGYGIAKSSVSRHWKAISMKKLEEFMERPLQDLDLVAILIDGIHFQDHLLTVSLGISSTGTKHVLGMWQGATENAQVCKELLEDMIRRGLDDEQKYLFVLDGSKALHKAVKAVFGARAEVQRCQVHKQRNVLSHLPKRYHFTFKSRMRIAWNMTNYKEAKKDLKKIVKDLKEVNESAATSLEEALEETLTLHRLQVSPSLRKSLRSTNLIESCFSNTRKFCRNVKNWKNGSMVLRWGGTMLHESEKSFRRVKGFRAMQSLIVALRKKAVEVIAKQA